MEGFRAADAGRRWLEAISDSELERVAAEQALRTEGVSGRINHVVYVSEPNPETRFHQHRPGDVVGAGDALRGRATVSTRSATVLLDAGETTPT